MTPTRANLLLAFLLWLAIVLAAVRYAPHDATVFMIYPGTEYNPEDVLAPDELWYI